MCFINGKRGIKNCHPYEEITNNVNSFCALDCIYNSSASCSGCENSFIEDVRSF